jgi:tRNA-modifying protein YgfZ
MSAGTIAYLDDRAVVRVAGPDARTFLQGLITNDMALLDTRPAMFAGLLSPQGKVLFEFFAVRVDDGVLLDVARGAAGDLARRLAMYKLRANVEIGEATGAGVTFTDPRAADLGARITGQAPDAAFEQRRIALGVPEGGKDYAFGTLFPHEAMFDQFNGVSFGKGCYVGQEIVSRMQHRGTARSRFLLVDAQAPLPPMGTPVMAGDKPLGEMGSNADKQGLALIRLDRLSDAYAAKSLLTTGDVPIRLSKPAYATFEVPAP